MELLIVLTPTKCQHQSILMLVVKGVLALVSVNFSKEFIHIIVRIHTNTNTVLRTSISTSACRGLSIVLTLFVHTSIGAHVCKGLSIVLMVIVVLC